MEMMLVVVLLLCGSVTFSSACSCFPHRGPESYCRYDLIFRGKAVSEYKQRSAPIDFGDPYWEYDPYSEWVYTVLVDKAVKMPENQREAQNVTIRTSTQGSLCGVQIPLDMDAVFFAYVNDEGNITTNLCAPNTPWEGLQEWDQQYFMEGLGKDCAKLASKAQD